MGSQHVQTYLHNANDGPPVMREILYASDDTSRIEESLGVGAQEHEQAHNRHRRPLNQPGHGGVKEQVPRQALDCARHMDQPRPAHPGAAVECHGGVEKSGEDAGVGAYVLEDRHGVER